MDTVRTRVGEHSGALFAFLARGWASFAGLVLVVLATTQLTAGEQGYFFTFQTLLHFQFLFELGFAVVLTQFVSHEWAHLRIEDGRVEGDQRARLRLAGLVRLARRWYAGVALSFVAVGAPAGAAFFAWRGDGGVDWVGPWIALCLAQGLAILYTPLPSMLEGIGDVARSQRSLLVANVAAAFAAWGALAAGFGLWAAPVQIGVRATVALTILLPATRPLRRVAADASDVRAVEGEWRPSFVRQQVRIAASWFGGLLTFQTFTPITFAVLGPVGAGQVGVLVQAFHAVNQLASAWLTAIQPTMGRLGSLGRFEELRGVVRLTTIRCMGTAAALALAVFTGLALVEWLSPRYAERFGSLSMAACFLTAAVAIQWPNVRTSVIRFQKMDPFVWVAWCAALATVTSTIVLGQLFGGVGIAAGFLATVVGVLGVVQHLVYRRSMSRLEAGSVPGTK